VRILRDSKASGMPKLKCPISIFADLAEETMVDKRLRSEILPQDKIE